MGIYKAEAIVLRSRVYGEADRILVLYTKEVGKLSAIAKGVRKTTSRLRGAVQLFNHTQLVLYTGKTLDTVTQGEAEEQFSYLEQDLELFTAASYCAELVDRLTPDREPQPRVFYLILSTLRALKDGNPELVARVFELKLLDILGYRPRLNGCVMGDHPVAGEGAQQVWFSIERGGVLCPACAQHCKEAIPLSPAVISVMGYILRSPLNQAVKAKISPKILREMAALLQRFLTYHGDVKLQSRYFFDALRESETTRHKKQ